MTQALTDAAVRSAIEATHGSILFAAQTLGVTRQEFLDYAADRPWVAALVDDYRDRLLDAARMQLHTAAAEQLPWAIRESLQTLGRDRGYGAPEYAGPFNIYSVPPSEPEPNFQSSSSSEPERGTACKNCSPSSTARPLHSKKPARTSQKGDWLLFRPQKWLAPIRQVWGQKGDWLLFRPPNWPASSRQV